MGSEYTFYDYIDADGGGVNVIKKWLDGEGKPAKAYFMNMILNLEASPPPHTLDSVWGKPYTKKMTSKKGENWKGFIEFRKTGTIQYRIIGQMHGRNVYLVATGIHKGQRFVTDISPKTAIERIEQMIQAPAKYRREHEHN